MRLLFKKKCDFWKKGEDGSFSDLDIEALNQFRQLELELLESDDDEKESKISEFCAKYQYTRIPLDVDKIGFNSSNHKFVIYLITEYKQITMNYIMK